MTDRRKPIPATVPARHVAGGVGGTGIGLLVVTYLEVGRELNLTPEQALSINLGVTALVTLLPSCLMTLMDKAIEVVREFRRPTERKEDEKVHSTDVGNLSHASGDRPGGS